MLFGIKMFFKNEIFSGTGLIFCGIYDRIQNVTPGTYKRKNAEDVKYNEKTF